MITSRKSGVLLRIVGMLAVVFILGVVAGCPPAVVEEEKPPPDEVTILEKPEFISLATMRVGSRGHIVMSGLGVGIEKTQGIGISVEPIPASATRFLAALAGEIDIFDLFGVEPIWAAYGTVAEPFIGLGPQPLRLLHNGYSVPVMVVTTKDVGYTTWEDLVAAGDEIRIPVLPTDPAIQNMLDAYWHATGLDRAREVMFESLPASWAGLRDGTIDIALVGVATAILAEIEAVRGIVALPLTDEMWEKALEIVALKTTVMLPDIPAAIDLRKAGIPEEGKRILDLPRPKFTLRDTPKNIVYFYIKGIVEGYEEFKDIHPTLKDYYDVESLLNLGRLLPLPFHEGAVRAFKDLGVWTSAHEEHQQKTLALEQDRLKD